MSLFSTLRFIGTHPLASHHRLAAYGRFFKWQIESRLRDEVIFEWIEGAKLIVRNGMTGATGNIYCGLHEFADMGFLLHFLRKDDLFIDVGANIGSYSILAAAVCGSRVLAFEPDPNTAFALRRNSEASGVVDRLEIVEAALGAASGRGRLTVGCDTTNQMLRNEELGGREVAVTTLDEIVCDRTPALIKIDVEGFEPEVVRGAFETLRKSSLKGIIIETVTPQIDDIFRTHDFVAASYDPFQRSLTIGDTIPDLRTSNTLYVRGDLQPILEAAPVRSVVGCSL